MEEITQHPKAEPTSNAEKAPENWTTGDERMTGAQASYLKTLAEEAGDNATDGLLDDWTDMAEERAWFLKSTLG